MRVNLKTLGCRLNEAELENWAQKFQQKGHKIVKNAEEANLVVLNTCAVTGEAVRKSRQSIRRIHRGNPSAKLVVSGCYASLKPEEVAESLGVDLVVLNQDKERLVELTETELDLKSMPQLSTEPGEVALFSRGRQRAFVKVQDGCRYRCTFCIVTHARGDEKSRAITEITDEINNLHSQGIQEVILTGVHLGGYGNDVDCNLTELIEAILANTSLPRIRLGSLEPWDLPNGFFDLFANKRLMPHLHLPLQSGSDAVLKRMARRCKTEEFSQIVHEARETVPSINITTDIIVGFPGETESEWQESFDFIEQTAFGHIHIFTYSPREGTKAATLPNQLTQAVKKGRSHQLHQLAEKMKTAFFEQQLGQSTPVLWEGNLDNIGTESTTIFGYTPNYTRVSTLTEVADKLINSIHLTSLENVSSDRKHIESAIID
ncbi:MAG: tRNA (N(6)-L-threonylcarbamoyladenosine(37)-C(2))-methylthiotransferase MtaB [Gammaproteobacteria bacterium]|nr:MAG: tRNA (N(6)-L-threonylcarbamoyladenosine(37)-C(2))-methylthiotransferase MtaB [Gammaproteobacteria bacterium]